MSAVSNNLIEHANKLAEGADVNNQNDIGLSPLHFVVSQGNIKSARTIIRYGANLNSKTASGFTPLHIVIQNSVKGSLFSSNTSPLVSVELCKLLICEGADLNIVDTCGNTALHHAVKAHSIVLTELLLSKDVAIDLHNTDGNTPLHLALNLAIPSICSLLLNKGANVDLADCNGNTPFHLLMKSKFPSHFFNILFHRFLDMEVNINKKNSNGNTVLMVAIECALNEDTILLLVNSGADINERNNEGNTPLMMALMYTPNYRRVLKTLIHGVANINIQNDEGDTALHIALHFSQDTGICHVVEMLLLAGSDINMQNVNGETPLHIAVSQHWCNDYLLQVFLKKTNINLNIKNNAGDTPLHLAVETGKKTTNTMIIKRLIDNGARMDIKNNTGKIPIYLTKHFPNARNLMVKHLFKMRIAGLPLPRFRIPVRPRLMETECLMEIAKIRATKINEKHSLDILFSLNKNPNYLASSEEFIENLLTNPEIEKIFPHYASLLRIHFRRARARICLLKMAHNVLESGRKVMYLQKLPFEMKQKIFEYLKDEDLHNLRKCIQDQSKMLCLKAYPLGEV